MVEGQGVEDILLDTGCSRTLVQEKLVPKSKVIPGQCINIHCAHGDSVVYLVAHVELEVEGIPVVVKAALSPTLPKSVLLSTDVECFPLLLKRAMSSKMEHGLMVTTRAQQRLQEEMSLEDNALVEEVPNCLSDEPSSSPTHIEEVDEQVGSKMDSSLFEGGKVKTSQTRRQKRAMRQKFAE